MLLKRARRHWLGLAAVALAVAFLATIVDVRWDGDPRPVGDADDLAALARRDDVNVLFVLIDTLRADRLGSWGYHRDTSPTLDRLAATGIRFGRNLAQSSWTKCSMASLWTGLLPARSGVTRFDHVVPEEATLPAERLRDAGFRTAAIYRNGWVAPNFGFAQGFDTYHRPRPRPLLPSERRQNPTLRFEGTDVGVIEAATAFLRTYRDDRWFLYVHLMDVHEYVYDQDSAKFGNSYSDVYDQAILRLDGVFEQLVRYLWRDDELAARTLVVVASDHGEAFHERGFEGHARNVYPEVTEVPLIFALPFRLEPGLVVNERSQNVDIWPTLLELLGLPETRPADGRSWAPRLRAAAAGEPPAAEPRPVFAHLDQTWGQARQRPRPQVAVALGEHRLVLTTAPPAREELFDRRGDRFETRNRIAEEPEVALRLRDEAQRYLAAEPAWGDEVPTVELGEMELNQLRALGYAVP